MNYLQSSDLIFKKSFFKGGLSSSKVYAFISLGKPLKTKEKTLFILKILKFLSQLFGHVGKRLDKISKGKDTL